MSRIIAFTGLKNSGKTTAANYLIEEYGFEPVSFAQPLKDSVAALLGITLEQIESWKNDPCAVVCVGMKVEDGWVVGDEIPFRLFLQRYGTEAHRGIPEFGANVWVDMAEDKLAGGGNYVIADCRFGNEGKAIHRCGGTVVNVIRHLTDTGDTHASEDGLPTGYIDFDLDNNGSVKELHCRIDLLLSAMGNSRTPGC